MSLEMTFLGTGGAFTDFRENYHNNMIVKTDDGYVLIDCGGTGPQSLKELGIHPWEVAGILVTHIHGDHVGGIEQLIWERYYTSASGAPGWLTTKIWSTSTILNELYHTLRGGLDEFVNDKGVTCRGGYGFLVEPIAMKSIKIGGVVFKFHATPHVRSETVDKPSFGVEIKKDGQEVYYTSDTIFRKDVGSLFPKASIIFHDCTFSDYYPQTVHTHYTELRKLHPSVRRRMVLMHHTKVPAKTDVKRDGFLGAAKRHQTFRM